MLRATLVITLAAATINPCKAQGSQNTHGISQPSFEITSVREVNLSRVQSSGGGVVQMFNPRPCKFSPDRVDCELTVQGLIREAWGIPVSESYRVDAGKQLTDGARAKAFDIRATMPIGTSVSTARLMLRTLLERDFELKAHSEVRSTKVYALELYRGQGRLPPEGTNPSLPKQLTFGTSGDSGYLSGSFVSLDEIASAINMNSDLGRPVINGTGLASRFSINIHWDKELGSGSPHVFSDPEFLHALQKEAGLTLEKRDLPVQILVVDSVRQSPIQSN